MKKPKKEKVFQDIEYSCGHIHRLNVTNMWESTVEKKREIFSKKLCKDCYIESQKSEIVESGHVDNVKMIGSDKQNEWAKRLRYDFKKAILAEIDAYSASGFLPSENKKKLLTGLDKMLSSKIESKWWIDSRMDRNSICANNEKSRLLEQFADGVVPSSISSSKFLG